MNIVVDFSPANKAPIIPKDSITVPVYFVVENILYKGHYHLNECYYAYLVGGSFDCFASRLGRYQSKICTHWCYINDLKLEI